ncbi:LURP-one-related 10-like protein [Tanacetum coccineum]
MTQPNSSLVSIIGSEFISPYPLEFNVETDWKGNLVITDNNNKTIFTVRSCDKSFNRQRLLMDANWKPIVTIEEKDWTLHKRWNVYSGESTLKSDMIFTTKEKHKIQILKTRVNVYLAHNSEFAYDFKLKGEYGKKRSAIYKGHSATPLAQMMHTAQRSQKGKFNFKLTINPNVDYAFVVALITIIDAIASPYKNPNVEGAKLTYGVSQGLLELVTKLARPS